MWISEQPWANGLLAVAEEEARERGEAVVAGHHVALALTRDETAIELLQRLGLHARPWRDYINYILGVNAGARAHREQRLRMGVRKHRSPAALYHHGPTRPDPTAVAVVEGAHHEADRAAQPVAASHVLVALATGSGGIGTGTAWWLGIGPAAVRRAAGLPPPPEPTPTSAAATLPHPQGRGALVLLGGGALPDAALTAVVELTAAAAGGTRVAVVGAAAGHGAPVQRRCAQLRGSVPDGEVTDAGLLNRDDAHDPRVLDRLAHADAIFLDGGDPQLLYQALAGTPALDVLVAASDRSAVVVGYSAGAQALGAGCRRGGWAEPYPVTLLGWLSGLVIVAHCSGPGRIDELRATMTTFSGTRGLGVAHAGAVLISAGWGRIESLAVGYDQGSVVLDHPDAWPHLLRHHPASFGYRAPMPQKDLGTD